MGHFSRAIINTGLARISQWSLVTGNKDDPADQDSDTSFSANAVVS
jgi:hypothetical protein